MIRQQLTARSRGVAPRKGVSAVELAITLPVMMIVLLASIDAGQAVNVWNKVDNASRMGARAAARNTTSTSTEVSAAVSAFLTAAFPGVSPTDLSAGVTVVVRDSDGATITNLTGVDVGDPISVEVTLDYDTVRWTQDFGLLANRDFVTTTQMRRE